MTRQSYFENQAVAILYNRAYQNKMHIKRQYLLEQLDNSRAVIRNNVNYKATKIYHELLSSNREYYQSLGEDQYTEAYTDAVEQVYNELTT